jgi:hypothetical protein
MPIPVTISAIAGCKGDEHQHGRDCARSGQHRNRERKHGRVRALGTAADLLIGLFGAGFAAEQHIDRDQEQQDAAGDCECGQRDPERFEDRVADRAHEQNDASGDQHRLIDDGGARFGRGVGRDGQRERDHPDRIDDRERRRKRGRDECGCHRCDIRRNVCVLIGNDAIILPIGELP